MFSVVSMFREQIVVDVIEWAAMRKGDFILFEARFSRRKKLSLIFGQLGKIPLVLLA